MLLFYPAEFRPRVCHWGEVLDLVEVAKRPADASGYYLWFDGRRLRLYRDQDPRGVCLSADDLAPRMTFAGELARACGVTRVHRPHVVDAMAGLGIEGMTLAGLGCRVTLFERLPALWALLDDFLTVNPRFGSELYCGDSRAWLDGRTNACCDTLYLDPMFLPRSKKALPGKAMQYVRALVDELPRQANELDLTACWIDRVACVARERVVLKRRKNDVAIGDPAWQVRGRMIRFDVYRGTA